MAAARVTTPAKAEVFEGELSAGGAAEAGRIERILLDLDGTDGAPAEHLAAEYPPPAPAKRASSRIPRNFPNCTTWFTISPSLRNLF